MTRSAHSARTLCAAAATAVALVCVLAAAAPQAPPLQPPTGSTTRISSGGDVGRYRGLYGEPESRRLDDDDPRQWPRMQSIRAIGTLSELPGRGRGAAQTPVSVPEYDNKYATHMVCGQKHCLAITPVPELRENFAATAGTWLFREVEMTGAIDQVIVPGDMNPPPIGFISWAITLASASPTRRSDSPGSTLEALVRGPEAAAGRTITVAGVFRGANLFADLPEQSRRGASDWVLQEGAFSIWVSGKAPRGDGWALDPRSRSDCAFRLEVRGRVETADGFVYLRAKDVSLLGREKPR